jgi:hypothetical protein
MIITTHYTKEGTPETGLTPTITIRLISNNNVVVNAELMTEVGGGFYKYDFVGYDENVEYAFIADAGITLSDYERYTTGTNELDTSKNVQTIRKVQTNAYKIDKTLNQMMVYDDDDTTPILTFDLKDDEGNSDSETVYERTPT